MKITEIGNEEAPNGGYLGSRIDDERSKPR